MGIADDLADDLARQTMAAMVELKNDVFYNDVAKVLGVSSPSMQEAFLTAIRVRLAAARGQTFLDLTLKAARDGGKAPQAPRDVEPASGGH
jgi:hypothetical protein